MESVKENAREVGKQNAKRLQPVISSKLPEPFSQKQRPQTSQHSQSRSDIIKSKEGLAINKYQPKYQETLKILGQMKISPTKKNQTEKFILRASKKLPNLSEQVNPLKTIKAHEVKLQEMITLSIVKSSSRSGAVRKTLHAPTLRIYTVKEVPLHPRIINELQN